MAGFHVHVECINAGSHGKNVRYKEWQKKKKKKLRDLCNVVVVRIVDTDLRNRSTWTTIYR